MSAPFSSETITTAPASTADKAVILSMFSELNLVLDTGGAVISQSSGGNSAAKDLLVSKNAEKRAEAEYAALQMLKREQRLQQKREQPRSALGQALEQFDQEVDERDAFISRHTKRRLKGIKKARGGTLKLPRGRRHRHEKCKRV